MLVTGQAVLTADHVASGSEHRVYLDRDEGLPVQAAVRSESEEVDLAVLILSEPIPGVEPMTYVRVDRGSWSKVTNCAAIGYPRQSKDRQGRASLTVEGFIRPANGLHPFSGGTADGEWLTLVGEEESWAPAPAKSLPDNGDRPWGGMSGAVVVRGEMVIGVIRSHNEAKGPRSLAVTPLTALKRLPKEKRHRLCEVLGIADIDSLPVIYGDDGQPGQPVQAQPHAPLWAFSAQVQQSFGGHLAQAGLVVPAQWDAVALGNLRRVHQAADATGEMLDALCMAAGALPLLARFGGHEIGIRKLQYLYLRHVGRWPNAITREEMLIDAASVSVSERRSKSTEPGYQPEPLTALARFMLSIAGTQNTLDGNLDKASLLVLKDWVTGALELQWQDAANFLDKEVGKRLWALIEVSATENARERTRPDAIILDIVPERGRITTHRIPCDATPGTVPEDAVLRALREAVELLPADDEVLIDLCLPRHWLDAELEHWEVVDVGGSYESMSDYYRNRPRLRWSMHRNDLRLRALLVRRTKAVDRSLDPCAIPGEITSSPAGFRDWLRDRNEEAKVHPPYFAGASPADNTHDPLGLLLRAGYGFAIWFPSPAISPQAADACVWAARMGADVRWQDRINDLPGSLAAKFRRHQPVVVWSDPDGREDFPLPAARGGGTLRGGSR